MEARARQEASGANWVSWEGLQGTMVTHGKHCVRVYFIVLGLASNTDLLSHIQRDSREFPHESTVPAFCQPRNCNRH